MKCVRSRAIYSDMFCNVVMALVLMAVTDKPVSAVTCYECNPCLTHSTWSTCTGERCANITDTHKRGMNYTLGAVASESG